jgi:hypothetical protein
MFLLMSAFAIFITVGQGMFGGSVRTQQRTKAGIIANNHYARIREWSRQLGIGHPNFDALPGPFAGTIPDPDWPEFSITSVFTTPTLLNPCSELEKVYPADPQIHKIRTAFRKINVTVSWSSIDPTASVKFSMLLASPRRTVRALNPVEVTAPSGIPNPAPSTGCAIPFEAHLMDDQNHVIPDVSFHWNVWPALPVGGDGQMTPDRNGFTASYNSLFTAPDGTAQSVPNSFCYARAVVTYYGIEYAGNSPTIQVGP